MDDKAVALTGGATISLHGARTRGKSVALTGFADPKPLTLGQQPKDKPSSYYKQQEIKRLMKGFMSQGVSKARSRELAKIWYQMSPEQRREVMRPDMAYDETTKKVVKK